MRVLLSCLMAIGLYIGLGKVIEKVTFGFSLNRVLSTDVPSVPSVDAPENINKFLSEPFYLMDAGSECFVFSSADGSTVLKLFKLDRFRYIYARKALFASKDYRSHRLERTFTSNWLSHTLLSQETALLYTHLNPTHSLSSPLIVYDRCHIAHTLDPNQVHFVLQKKGTPLLTHFQTLIDANEIDKAKEGIDSFIELISTRCLKGIADSDSLCRNFGFIDGHAFEIDTGAFSPSPQMKERWIYTHELYYATQELKEWLKSKSPELALYLQTQVEAKLS